MNEIGTLRLRAGNDAGIVALPPQGRGESLPLDGCAWVVLDVETTGLNTHADEIIEIGAVRIERGEEEQYRVHFVGGNLDDILEKIVDE